MDLFEVPVAQDPTLTPLAERVRPERLADVVGQPALTDTDGLLARALKSGHVPSLILWGPPGSGKTTLARVIAKETQADFVPFSAVTGGVPELRKELLAAEERRRYRGTRTLLFVDEIHRFSKAQQDALLPYVESGAVILLGATTENPSFAVNAALLSRARAVQLAALDANALVTLLQRALDDRARGLGNAGVTVTGEALTAIARDADGDARRALGTLETAVQHTTARGGKRIDLDDLATALSGPRLRYDKSGEEHHNVTSAFIKSMRGTDPDASVYWLMRMVEAGEDPLFILRRMIVFASEDIGNADPRALELAMAADAAFQRLGMPEGLYALAQCCLYLAAAPKSNASTLAWQRAQADVRRHGTLPVPHHLRNAATPLMRAEGYGKGYRYPHDEGGFAPGVTYLPESLAGARYYEPTNLGLEQRLGEWLERLRRRAT